MNKINLVGCLAWLIGSLMASTGSCQPEVYDAQLEIPGTNRGVEFGLMIAKAKDFELAKNPSLRGYIVNGDEQIEIPVVEFEDERLVFKFPHYDSVITTTTTKEVFGAKFGSDKFELSGEYRKRRGDDKWAVMPFKAKLAASEFGEADTELFAGSWKVKFDSSDDPAVAKFHRDQDTNRVLGTFLTTTGDYRYLSGYVKDKQLTICCFDGAHAFRFEAKRQSNGELAGDFWSSNTWHEKWTAVKDDNAKLPDAFEQTAIKVESGLTDLQFPDLDGKKRRLDDAEFQGPARLIYVFGSWCPNCHDAAAYFKELQNKYGSRGLKILGLAFEVTSDHERNAAQVRTYLKRHGVEYPVLIAGPSDKPEASKKFPVLDKVRSYPTTIFLDGKGKVHAVHTGFTGPATGKSYDELKQKFESLIEEMLLSKD